MKASDTALVYIITHLELGGAQKVCLSLFHGMHEQGFVPYLITGPEGALAPQVIHKDRVIVISTMKRAIGLSALWQEWKTFSTLVRTLHALKKKHKKVIVHTHCTKAGIVGRWAAFFARIAERIHTVHGFAFHDHQSRIAWWLTYLAELVTSCITTHFVCVSIADIKMGTRLFPRFAHKHSLIRAAVAWERFYKPARSLSGSPQPFVFGTISCFKAQKNLFDLLRAFRFAHHRFAHARLEIIGDGILRPALEAWIAENNLSSVITLHGWQEEVATHMMRWHAFALSSLWEGLPCAVVEARLLQLPVLAYDTGGIHEVITSGHNGFLYSQKDWESLAQGMIQLMESPEVYKTLRTNSDSLHDFKNETMIAQHSSLYRMHL